MMRKRISGFVAPLLATWALSVNAQGSAPAEGWLITPAEAIAFKGEEGFNAPPALRPRAAMPLINILKPEPAPGLKVKAPFAIAVQFVGQADAPIDPAT